MGKHRATAKGIVLIYEKDGSPTERHEFDYTGEFIGIIRKDCTNYISQPLADRVMDWANTVTRDWLRTGSDTPYEFETETTEYSVQFPD